MKHDKLKAQGKTVASVVPMNLVDCDRAHQNLISAMTNLMEHFRQQIAAQNSENDAEHAVALVDYLKDRASEYAYHLSKGKHRAIELMKEVGIPEPHKRFNQYPFEFSGGMRQRIVIAIALSANPDILICDEPTTALDVTIQAQILKLMENLKNELGTSMIMITHDLGVVAETCDKVAVMYAGEIVEYGTARDIFDPGDHHPYTVGLFNAIPNLDEKTDRLHPIDGLMPDPTNLPAGCKFSPRCPYCTEECVNGTPYTYEEDGHRIFCNRFRKEG